jgi:hypothetical protein
MHRRAVGAAAPSRVVTENWQDMDDREQVQEVLRVGLLGRGELSAHPAEQAFFGADVVRDAVPPGPFLLVIELPEPLSTAQVVICRDVVHGPVGADALVLLTEA